MYLKDFFCFEESLEKDLKIWYNWGVIVFIRFIVVVIFGCP